MLVVDARRAPIAKWYDSEVAGERGRREDLESRVDGRKEGFADSRPCACGETNSKAKRNERGRPSSRTPTQLSSSRPPSCPSVASPHPSPTPFLPSSFSPSSSSSPFPPLHSHASSSGSSFPPLTTNDHDPQDSA